ncbi:hypothetical protein HHI36_022169 [Cryptolaemus montrouzieri]|uniref:Uncharacterized protein n=1 Tax=Cryptolaemus montrouzieri TaxID=559131 RepID=A0ABD2MZE1_9CUCU
MILILENYEELDYRTHDNQEYEAKSDISREKEKGCDVYDNVESEDLASQSYFRKNRFKWCLIPPATDERICSYDLNVYLPGVTGPA